MAANKKAAPVATKKAGAPKKKGGNTEQSTGQTTLKTNHVTKLKGANTPHKVKRVLAQTGKRTGVDAATVEALAKTKDVDTINKLLS